MKELNGTADQRGTLGDTIATIILSLQYAFVMINEGLLIFAILKMYKLIKSQANSEARTTQFLFAGSIAFVALISNLLSAFWDVLYEWDWVYATRPRPQFGKIEEEEIKVEEIQPDVEFGERTESELIREVQYELDLESESDEEYKNLDEEAKERKRIMKKQIKKMLCERKGIVYQSFKESDEESKQEKEPLLINT